MKTKIPKKWHWNRIENRFGGGIPDVFLCAEGVPFWVELKTTKTHRVNISSHQVSWHFAYHRAGGISFFLVNPLSSPNLYLFGGEQGRELVVNGLRSGESGTVVPCQWSGADWSGAIDHMFGAARGRVGVQGPGSGSGHSGSGHSGSGHSGSGSKKIHSGYPLV